MRTAPPARSSSACATATTWRAAMSTGAVTARGGSRRRTPPISGRTRRGDWRTAVLYGRRRPLGGLRTGDGADNGEGVLGVVLSIDLESGGGGSLCQARRARADGGRRQVPGAWRRRPDL